MPLTNAAIRKIFEFAWRGPMISTKQAVHRQKRKKERKNSTETNSFFFSARKYFPLLEYFWPASKWENRSAVQLVFVCPQTCVFVATDKLLEVKLSSYKSLCPSVSWLIGRWDGGIISWRKGGQKLHFQRSSKSAC